MVFGILKSSSMVLNDIAYSLNENIALKKVNERLYRNLLKENDISTFHSYITKALSYLNNDKMVFLVDDSDIIKPYGVKFENIGMVKDGSSLTEKYEKGYRLTAIAGLSKNTKHPVPIYNKVYSEEKKEFKSTNLETKKALNMVISHIKDYQGVFVFDRGYDDTKLMNYLISNKQYFVIRIRNNRVLKRKDKKIKIFDDAKRRKGKVIVPIKYRGEDISLKVSHIEGNINRVKDKITIIFSYLDFETEPMVLITNIKIHSKEDLIKASLHYISRWKIEELFRFKKVQFGLENFRVKASTSINNLFFILDIAMLVMVHIIEHKNRNIIYNELMALSKRIKDNVSIEYYQLITGIMTIFARNEKGVKNYQKIERWTTEEYNLFNSLELKSKKRVRIKQAKHQ
ncbi:MAG: transposase [Acholeplasmataceae bacterium]